MKDELLNELREDIDDYFAAGRRNNIIDIILTCVVVVASVLAAGLDKGWRWLTAVTAALPAALTSIQSRLRIAELSTWYFRYSAALRALERELRVATAPDIEVFTKRRSDIDDEFERLWHELKTRPGPSQTTNAQAPPSPRRRVRARPNPKAPSSHQPSDKSRTEEV